MATNLMLMGAKAKGDPQADKWRTPPYLLEAVNEFYEGKWFDPCPANPDFDGLAMKWPPDTYINPPFSQYKKWSEHGWHQAMDQIWMSHHNHDTGWWQSVPVDAMCLLFDRVKFINPETGKPGTTAIGKCQTLRYRGNNVARFAAVFRGLGQIVEVRL